MIDGPAFAKASAGTREVIIGMKRDVTFGPTLVFGLGGIFAEAIKDTTMRIAPFKKEEALKMMQEIKGIKILEGMRGQPPVNFDLLADIMMNLSRLALEHPEIKEIDLNPVICSENSVTVVDARVMI
jgi:acetyltransferase